MKKLLVLSAFIAPFLLNGCDDTDNLNPTETILWRQCEAQDQHVSCRSAYRETFNQVTYANVVNNDNMPFANQPIVFQLEDKAFKRNNPNLRSINDLWHDSTGRWIYTPEDLKGSTTDEVKKVGETYVLSPSMYDELISAVKTCNRASVDAMSFKMGSTLSPEDYNKVMNIILDCKKFQLEQAVNQK